jgi:hypothetical protein
MPASLDVISSDNQQEKDTFAMERSNKRVVSGVVVVWKGRDDKHVNGVLLLQPRQVAAVELNASGLHRGWYFDDI